MDTSTAFRASLSLESCGTGNPVDLLKQATFLREARRQGDYEWALATIKAKRAEYRQWVANRQNEWAAKVSRRPQRGNHHDSWETREMYVRSTASGHSGPTYRHPNTVLHPGYWYRLPMTVRAPKAPVLP